MSSVCLIHMSCQNKAEIMYEKVEERVLKHQNDLITVPHICRHPTVKRKERVGANSRKGSDVLVNTLL